MSKLVVQEDYRFREKKRREFSPDWILTDGHWLCIPRSL